MTFLKNFSFSQSVSRLFHYLEDSSIPISNVVLSGLFAIILRIFIEAFSQQSINYFNLDPAIFAVGILHWALFYLLIAVSLIIIVHYAVKEKIETLFRVVFPGMIILIVAPIIDLIVSGGAGYSMYYISPYSTDLLKNFFTYMSFHQGATIGIKIEFLLICCACFLYMRFKGKEWALSIAYVIVFYAVGFLLAAAQPFLRATMTLAGFTASGDFMLINYFSVLLLLGLLWMLWLADKKMLGILLADCRLSRISYYVFMLLLGTMLGLVLTGQPFLDQLHAKPDIILELFFTIISLFFASIYTIIFNNIADIDIDRISNPDRPLVRKQIDEKTYRCIAWCSLAISLYFACLAGLVALYLMTFVIGIYYLYSMPPIRFKRLLLFSKLTVSLSSLSLVMLGFIIVRNNLVGFPHSIYPIFLIGITLCANLIDIKDKQGDEAAGINTLPVVLGLKLAKRVVGISIILTYVSFYFLVRNATLAAMLLGLGGLQYYLVNNEKYAEWKVVGVNMIAFLLLLGYLSQQV